VALARAVARMPRADALPGSLSYEPKWDGYRCVAIHNNQGVTLWSGRARSSPGTSQNFAALAAEVPPGCVVDGESAIWAGGRLDFSALQQRLGRRQESCGFTWQRS
jgi:ATP-dependent DNA ligase